MATKKNSASLPTDTLVCHIHNDVKGLKSVDNSIDQDKYEIRESVCFNEEPLTQHSDGNYYCLFHLPTINKDVNKFEEKFEARLKAVENNVVAIRKRPLDEQKELVETISNDFRYVWFPSDVVFFGQRFECPVDFTGAHFARRAIFISTKFAASVVFESATFSIGANFMLASFRGNADFSGTVFHSIAVFAGSSFLNGAEFGRAIFSGMCDFEQTKFSNTHETSFSRASFAQDTIFDDVEFNNKVSFNSAIFGPDSDVFFRRAFFAGNADFQYSTAEGYLRFSSIRQGKKNEFDFQEAAFEKASRVSFHTVDLRPHWFVNVDSRKFGFTDVFWINLDWDFWNKNIHTELDSMADTGATKQKKRIFEVATRQLAVNAEENNRYEEAAKFRYMAMETRRLETAKTFSASRPLIWLYKWTSGYGERWSLAAVVLFTVLIFFGLIYDSPFATFTDPEKKPAISHTTSDESNIKMNNSEGIVYSLYVATLQRPEPKPADTLTRFFVILETIFAPLQAALLALAIRRKFMR